METRILAPAYLSQFRCIGPDCEDTCCVGWQVAVDRATLARYLTVDHPELGPELREKVADGWIRLGDDLVCPFLGPDSWCRIHAALGEPFLSLTCTSYPRIQHLVDGSGIRAASLSCPEAARLALLDPGAMELAIVPDADAQRVAGSLINSAAMDALSPWRQFQLVRDRILRLLRVSGAPIEARMYALGRVLQSLGEEDVLLDDDVALAFGAAERQLPRLAADLAEIEVPQAARFQILGSLFADQFRRVGGGARHAALVARAAGGLGYSDAADKAHVAAACARATREHLSPYLDSRPFVLENYLVNQVLATTFPFGKDRTWFEAYSVLVAKYAVVRLLLAGVAAFERRMDDALLVETVQTFQRAVDHSPDYLADLVERLHKGGVDTLAHMVMLILA